MRICSSWVSFWYISVAVFAAPVFLAGATLSICILSFSISARGLPAAFLTGAFFCFLALGGVLSSMPSSLSLPKDPSSSSLSGFGRFLPAAFAPVRVVWVNFFAAGAFGAAAFLAAGFLALGFYIAEKRKGLA